ILLGEGGVLRDGEPADVLDYYYALISAREDSAEEDADLGELGRRSGNGRARMTSVQLLGASEINAVQAPIFRVGEAARLRIEYGCQEELPGLTLGMTIRDRTGYDVFGMNTRRQGWTDIGMRPGVRQVIE